LQPWLFQGKLTRVEIRPCQRKVIRKLCFLTFEDILPRGFYLQAKEVQFAKWGPAEGAELNPYAGRRFKLADCLLKKILLHRRDMQSQDKGERDKEDTQESPGEQPEQKRSALRAFFPDGFLRSQQDKSSFTK